MVSVVELHVTLLCPFYKTLSTKSRNSSDYCHCDSHCFCHSFGHGACRVHLHIPYIHLLFQYDQQLLHWQCRSSRCCMPCTMSPTCQAYRTGLITAESNPIRSTAPIHPDPELHPFSHLYSHLQTKHLSLVWKNFFPSSTSLSNERKY